MKNATLILFYILIIIGCNQSQNKNKVSDKGKSEINKENHCIIPPEILNYINDHSEFEIVEKKDLKLLEKYKYDTDISCLLITYGDFNNNGYEDFAIILRYKGYKSIGYINYDFPFLVIFNDFKQEIKPNLLYKTGFYKEDVVKTVIYDQFDEGIFSFIQKDRLCGKDVINIVIPEKSIFRIIWDDVEKTYFYYNSSDDFSCDNTSQSISQIMQNKLSTPEEVTDYLIFTKDTQGELQINTEILDYISETTTRENSNYLLALERFQQKTYSNRGDWSSDDFVKIQAYIFNTTYPLRKKYWIDNVPEWYGGKPEQLLGSRSNWMDNNYYGLPMLEKYTIDFIRNYW